MEHLQNSPLEQELEPQHRMLVDCEVLANRWGGPAYEEGLVDGAGISRSIRERGVMDRTELTFTAERYRDNAHREVDYVEYGLQISVTRELTVADFPAVALEAVRAYYVDDTDDEAALARYEKMLKSPYTVFEEKLMVEYTVKDDQPIPEVRYETQYLIDGDEVYSTSSEDNEAIVEESQAHHEFDGLVAMPEDPTGQLLENPLSEQEWEIVEQLNEQIKIEKELDIDPSVLAAMARIQRKLDRREHLQEKNMPCSFLKFNER